MTRTTPLRTILLHARIPTTTVRLGVSLRALSSMPPPRFSAGSDEEALQESLTGILSASGGRWALTSNGEGIERSFRFKTFAKTWDFMTAVSLQCKLQNHHPEWSNVFNTTFIRWTTHSPKGLSARDVSMAAMCDSLAKDFGEIEAPPPTSSCEIRSLADRAASSSGDCCTPKAKS